MITVEEIANKHFRRTLLGYDAEQVDACLDEIIDQLNTMQQDRREMVGTIEYLTAELVRAGASQSKKAEAVPVEPISPHDL